METIINFNAEEKTANCFTLDKTMKRKWEKLIEERPEEVKVIKRNEDLLEIEVPKKWVKVRPPRKMSDEQREAASERLKAVREKKLFETG